MKILKSLFFFGAYMWIMYYVDEYYANKILNLFKKSILRKDQT